MLIPSPLLLRLLVALLVAAIAAAIWPQFDLLWQAGSVTLLLIGAIDALAALQPWPLAARRQVPGSLPLGVWHTVALRVASHATGMCVVVSAPVAKNTGTVTARSTNETAAFSR